MKNFLLEILCEEIPADLQETGAINLLNIFKKIIINLGITIINEDFNNQYFYSPRRITLNLTLSCVEFNKLEIIRGPRVGVDSDILEKFLQKNNISPLSCQSSLQNKKNLIEVEQNKIKYHAIQIEQTLNSSENSTMQNLANICVESFKQLTWPRTMTWKANGEKWIRPIRNILALFNNKIINFEFAGVQTSNFTFGHKILTHNIKIKINTIDEYQKILREKSVIINHIERKEKIKNCIEDQLSRYAYISINSSHEKFIRNLANIVEFPDILECRIPNEFMHLPHQLIEYVMMHHQKYIPLYDISNEYRNLSQEFLVIIDHNNPNDKMKNGYAKVLNARLSDAQFFWDKFCNTKIEDLVENLKLSQSEYIPEMNILEFNKNINKKLLEIYNYDIDLNILSCDLGSDIYSEYPALRGFLSSPYLQKNNYSKTTSDIAKEIYYGESELYERDYIPQNKISQTIVALKYQAKLRYYLIDKEEKPTTSRDPFALKRAIRIIHDLDKKLLDVFNENTFVKSVIENYKK